jgi:GNAT superfamily N-acetyltransferase
VLRLTTADPDQIETILDGTYPIWGEGLSRPAYSAWNQAQMRTAWGRQHLRRMALIGGETLLASAKRYDFNAWIGFDLTPVMGLGAVFTPEPLRRHGHGRTLMNLLLQDAETRGCRYALLFSEIGPAYYESFGFLVLPREMRTIAVDRLKGPPATFVRSGEPGDLPAIADIAARYSAGSAFGLQRTASLIEYAFARRRLLVGLGPTGLRHTEFFVAEEGHRPVAYVFITHGPAGSMLEECGDCDPDGARVGAILQVLAARTPAEPVLRLTTWLPESFRPPQLRVIGSQPAAELMMYRPIGDAPALETTASPIVYWQTDVF